MTQEVLFQVILLLSNTVQTITGFAGTLLAMPFSIRVVGVEEAKAVLNVFTIMACLIITVQNRKAINYKVLGKMIGGMLIGMLAGIWLFDRIPLPTLLKAYAVLVILVALKKLFIKREIALPGWTMIIVLLAAGVIHGMFVSGGALLVVYAVSTLKEKDEFRATVAPVWVVLNSILIVSHYQAGYYNQTTIRAIAVSVVPLILSIYIGNYLYKKINQDVFLKLTYILLLLSGASLLL